MSRILLDLLISVDFDAVDTALTGFGICAYPKSTLIRSLRLSEAYAYLQKISRNFRLSDCMTRSGKWSPRGMRKILPQAEYSQDNFFCITQKSSTVVPLDKKAIFQGSLKSSAPAPRPQPWPDSCGHRGILWSGGRNSDQSAHKVLQSWLCLPWR